MAAAARQESRRRKNVRPRDGNKKRKAVGTSAIDLIRQRKRRAKAHIQLQHMPLHILEQIFFASENLNLPKCNSLIGWRLSQRPTLVRLIAAALDPTWDVWFGILAKEVFSYRGWQNDAKRIAGNAEFQSAVFACHWVNIELVLNAYEMWYAQRGAGRPYTPTYSSTVAKGRLEGSLAWETEFEAQEKRRCEPADPRRCFQEDRESSVVLFW
jgi:hypothetical protein